MRVERQNNFRIKRTTENHDYPLFPNNGPTTHLGQIADAFKDIDGRIDKVVTDMGELSMDNITDATATGKAVVTAETPDAAREAIGAAATEDVTTEAEARKSADDALGKRVDAEKQYRADGDAKLQKAIDGEAEARQEADELKADKTYVDEQLGTKLDAADKPTADTLEGVTETGRSVMKAESQETARTAIDAAATKHTHEIADVDGLQGELDTKQNAADAFSGDYNDLQNVPEEFKPEHHTHPIEDVDGLQDKLDGKLAADAVATAAIKLETIRNINVTGDATGTATFDGTADADINITLTNAGTVGRQLLKAETVADASNTLELLSVLDYKGSVDSEDALPEEAQIGDVYNVTDTGMNYAWNGTSWDALGSVTTLASLGVTATTDELNYVDGVTSAIQAQLDAKATKTDIADMETKTEAAATYQPKGDYATKTEVTEGLAAKQDAATAFDGKYTSLTEVPSEFTPKAHTHEIADVNGLQTALDGKADKTAIADMETKTEAAETYQPKGEYLTADAIADMETKTEAASTYATKGELATKQDAATAFDGKYTSLTEVPSQFTPAAHTHAIADVTGLQGALDAKADTSAIPTIPGNATASEAGLMSAADKTKLDGLTAMNQAEFVADPAGDTVTKEEFIAFRDALVTAGIMKPQA